MRRLPCPRDYRTAKLHAVFLESLAVPEGWILRGRDLARYVFADVHNEGFRKDFMLLKVRRSRIWQVLNNCLSKDSRMVGGTY